jgi:hypothetical protein
MHHTRNTLWWRHATCALPVRLMCRAPRAQNFTRFSAWFGNYSHANKEKRLLAELSCAMAAGDTGATCSRSSVRLDYLPALRQVRACLQLQAHSYVRGVAVRGQGASLREALVGAWRRHMSPDALAWLACCCAAGADNAAGARGRGRHPDRRRHHAGL